MKKILIIASLFLSALTFAQVPQGISYQAIAINGSGAPVVSGNVRVKLSILDTSATGTVLYSETQLKTTNAQGLFNLVIGQGTIVSGTFTAINWGTNSKFLKVEMDATGGTTYVAVGTTQLLSVPYAMHAGSVASIAGNTGINDDIVSNQSSNFGFIDFSDSKAYVFNSIIGTWSSQAFNPNSSPDLVETKGSFAFIDFTTSKVFVCNGKTGIWSSQTFNSNSSPTLTASNGNFVFTDYSGSKIYSYNGKTGAWSSQSFNPNSSPDLVQTNGNFAFVDFTDSKVYAFNGRTGSWSFQTFNSNSSPTLTASNGNFAFIDFTDSKAYTYNGRTGTWVSQTFNSNSSPTITVSETN
ncbi:hypothetical protein [Flavobacterium sp. N1994]|uniref:hypothetical protein n=1 Tax=Flavobacterium sp. N1994 TaxID=2986827 RepID=UPI0022233171|nr:hypothetical protein [Flavobacterium sp. N1994]